MDVSEREAMARAIVDGNRYMTLGTADAGGLPWASPVWFAPASYRELFWVSKPGARHSQNIAARPEVGIVIFDSTVPISTGKAVYMAALAEEVGARGRDRARACSSSHGVRSSTAAAPGLPPTSERPRASVSTVRGHRSSSCSRRRTSGCRSGWNSHGLTRGGPPGADTTRTAP